MNRFIVTGITFGVFMTEAIIHYSLGMSKAEGKFRLHFPPPAELAKVALVTGVFSVVSGALISTVERRFGAR